MNFEEKCKSFVTVKLMLLIAGGTFLYSKETFAHDPEQGCSNLGFSLSVVPTVNTTNGRIEVAGIPPGSVIAKLVPENVAGVCDTGYSTNPGVGDIPPGLGFIVYRSNNCNAGNAFDKDGNISMFCLAGENTNAVLQYDGNNGPANVQPVDKATNAIILWKKKPGLTVIPLASMADFSKFYSTWGAYDWNMKEEFLSRAVIPPTITLVYTPTCSAEVNDIAFGTLSPSEIKENRVSPLRATVNVRCNDILPKYTVTFSSPRGVLGDKTTILSDNASIGFQLSWINGSVQENIKLDHPYERSTISEEFSIPVDVVPVPLPSAGKINPGRADSALTINLKFS
ncbi:hypothetical protein E2D26_23405 [Salmonella enterica subsp. enterica serovar Richmond]|nr:hypothetical protein [Salmonella enterica subsp. enterica serovar Newport]EBZ2758218.1 hypothetical protein [Salmonella enterica subsp. enterica serovar Pomona]ECB6368179.1 hypothetical protein [Salmonella enterica subsp. enterica serovar Richmond]ECF2403947.1 hypothetical protein [Salmonella enterica subsp. enterica serovar Singapore]ECH8956803.1 hypothetical protein [Salmonella enterica subsp. enterica serovar Hvittingfoss]ECQ1364906.1 hypothetical protein [Salmonella enterica subsp. ente